MRRAVNLFALGVLAAAGLVAGVYAPGSGARSATAGARLRITVKASEFRFALSRRSVPVGSTVVFTVINIGKIYHDYRINGKQTPTLYPRQKATLTVKFTKKGQISYVCTLVGHAGAGMKGVLSVGGGPPTGRTTTRTTTTTATTTTTTTTETTTTTTTTTT